MAARMGRGLMPRRLRRALTPSPARRMARFSSGTPVPSLASTRSGSGLYEERTQLGRAAQFAKCPKQCAMLEGKYANGLDWRNKVLHEVIEQSGFADVPQRVMPVASLLRPMAALHKNTKWECTLDCTHYCYHPDVWTALLDGLYRRLLNHEFVDGGGGGDGGGKRKGGGGRRAAKLSRLG